MDRSHFYEANKTGLVFFYFSMIFGEFARSLFYRKKRKTKEKKKGLHGLDPTHNKVGPTARI